MPRNIQATSTSKVIRRNIHVKRLLSILSAVVLSLTLAVPAFAATTGTTETLTVPTQLTVTGIPTSIDYGTLTPGQASTAQIIHVTIDANTAWSLKISGTNFSDGGTQSINAGARKGTINNVVGVSGGDLYAGLGTETGFGNAPYDGTTQVLKHSSGSHVTFDMNLRVVVPAATGSGAYTGSVTYTVN